MIRQQINLFVRQETVRAPFSALMCGLITLVVVVLVSGLYGYEYVALRTLQAELVEAQAAQRQRDADIAELRRQNQARKADPQLQAQRRRLAVELQSRRLYGRMLDRVEPGQQVVFSELLHGLSAQAVPGVWLTRIAARDGGVHLQLQGETQDANLIPRYLRQLGGEVAYSEAEFDGFRVNEQEDRLRFEVNCVLKSGGRT